MASKDVAFSPAEGVPIVLTGSTTDMSDFKLSPFRAFTGGFPTAIIPRFLLRRYWYPRAPKNHDDTAKFAPYGMRKIEAALIKKYGKQSVAVVHPYNLEKFVGPATKVIGISSMEPAGTGFVSRTYTSLVGFGGEPVAAAEFRDLITKPLLRRWGAKIILGGSGAWQIHRAKLQKEYGIDCIVMGEGEKTALKIFHKALNGEKLPKIIETEPPEPKKICCITPDPSRLQVARGHGLHVSVLPLRQDSGRPRFSHSSTPRCTGVPESDDPLVAWLAEHREACR